MSLITILEAGRRDFLEAAQSVPQGQASRKPAPQCWSVLECIEHVAVAEGRFLSWISSGTAIQPQRDTDKEIRLFNTIRSRATKIEAPEPVRPQGRFETLEAALAAFNEARDLSIQLVQDRGDSLYSIGANHPRFGNMNGAEVIHLIDGHARRHAEQIREICETLL
jgi:hypothetical protein